MKKNLLIAGVVIVAIALVIIAMTLESGSENTGDNMTPTIPLAQIVSYEDCVNAGFPVMERYPEQCRRPDGKTFVRDIGNELEKRNLIQVATPRPQDTVSSKITVTGKARGPWFFEASFPMELQADDGAVLGTSFAEAQDEWMTEEFVPFAGQLQIDDFQGYTKGNLILKKDNPSGEPELDDELRIPVKFKL